MNTTNSKAHKLIGLTVALALGLVAGVASATKRDVVITKNDARFTPEAKVTAADTTALNDALTNWKKSYYRIEIFDKGKRTGVRGSYRLDRVTEAELAKDAKRVGLSASAGIVHGLSCGGNDAGRIAADSTKAKASSASAATTPLPSPSPSPSVNPCSEVKAKIENILGKYTKK